MRRLLALLLTIGIGISAAPRELRHAQSLSFSQSPTTTDKSAPAGEFARLVERLSEPGGYFDTDNLISNEASYLHVLGRLRKMNVDGGAYVGVGPDQNFSYIAQIRPRIAYIIDIRRDNLIEHLLFKALFSLSRNRIEYLCNLTARSTPPQSDKWRDKTIVDLVAHVDSATGDREHFNAISAADRERFNAVSAAVVNKVKTFGVPLNDTERETLVRIHQAFFESGLDLRFTSRGRPSRFYYPTFRDLLLEKDLTGKQSNYLASEDGFQFLKELEASNLVVPVVGDFAGDQALRAIGRDITERGLKVSAFYTSNVEFYLMREGTFDRWVENLKRLPIEPKSVIIRSYFNGSFGQPHHPQTVNGYYSTQLLQTIESLLREHAAGGYETYSDLVTKQSLDLK